MSEKTSAKHNKELRLNLSLESEMGYTNQCESMRINANQRESTRINATKEQWYLHINNLENVSL